MNLAKLQMQLLPGGCGINFMAARGSQKVLAVLMTQKHPQLITSTLAAPNSIAALSIFTLHVYLFYHTFSVL